MRTQPAQDRYLEKPFHGSSHVWASDILRNLGESTSLLDIGAGSGLMGRLALELGIEKRVAIEIDPGAQEFIRPLYTSVHSSIEGLSNQSFDVILLLDLLEHLPAPFQYLTQVETLLSERGQILISVPNIAHWSVRLPLIFGYFEYTDRGILDRTHLQFFTRKRFRALLHSCRNCAVLSESSSIEPIEFLLPKPIWDNPLFRTVANIRLSVAKALPGFFAYQHLAVLKRK